MRGNAEASRDPLACNFCENQHAGAKQSEKNRQERLLTTQPFLLLEGHKKYLQQEIILFDDVYTTGRTLYHAKTSPVQAWIQIGSFDYDRKIINHKH